MLELNTGLELKTELSDIAIKNYFDKQEYKRQQEKALAYSSSIRKKEKQTRVILSVLIGSVLGLIFGLCHVVTVSAATFSKKEWIDIYYISITVEAEAGNQTELGKRLVADTVLNRLNNGNFGSDVKSIIDAENQYCDGIQASTDTIRIVMEEYKSQTNYEVLYFRTKKYHSWAIDLFQEDDHYFSK